MALTKKQIYDLNNMNVAAQNANLGDAINNGLPTVSAGDEGSFLCVVNGEWKATKIPTADSRMW